MPPPGVHFKSRDLGLSNNGTPDVVAGVWDVSGNVGIWPDKGWLCCTFVTVSQVSVAFPPGIVLFGSDR